MKRSFIPIFMLVLLPILPVWAIDSQELMARHQQALAGETGRLANVNGVGYIGTVEKYGLQGDVNIYSAGSERFAWIQLFRPFTERQVLRGKTAEMLEMTGWRRAMLPVEANELKALQFMLGYLYLRPGAPLPDNLREQGETIAARLTTSDGVAVEAVFDSQGFLLKSFTITGYAYRREFIIESYNTVDGIKFPAAIRENSTNPAVYTFRVINMNPALEGSQFNIPPELPATNLPDRGSVRIPIQNYFELPLVKGWFGNSPALTFLVDTSLPFSVIDRSIAAQLGLTPEGKIVRPARYPLGDFSFVRVPSFLLRELEFKDRLFLVANMMPSSVNVQFPIHGILGTDLFHQQVIQLDLAGESLRVLNPKGFVADGRWKRIPMIAQGGSYSVLARLGELDVPLEIASSLASAVLLPEGSGVATAVSRQQSRNAAALTTGLLYGLPEKIYKVENLVLGDLAVPPVFLHSAQFPADSPYSRWQGGWLGNTILRKFSAYIDFPNSLLYLEAGQQFNNPDHFNTAGVYFVKSGGKVVIQQVLKDSPAEKAGLRPGDVVAQIQEYPTEQMVFDRLYNIFSADSGQTISLKIVREDASLDINVVTESPF